MTGRLPNRRQVHWEQGCQMGAFRTVSRQQSVSKRGRPKSPGNAIPTAQRGALPRTGRIHPASLLERARLRE